MKNLIYNFKIAVLLFYCTYFISINCNAQTFQFTYDGAGNRIKQVKTGTMPVPSLTASLNTIQAGQNSTLNLSNCSGIVTWSNNRNGFTQIVSPTQNSYYYAKCNQNGCISQSNKVEIGVQNASPCNQYQFIADEIIANQNQKVIANQKIDASSVISNSSTVDFSAGGAIDLKPGFDASAGKFRAFIEPCAVAPIDGLIAYYPFSNNSNDESGNKNHATANGPVLVTDRFGNQNSAYQFDGVDDFITTPVYQSSITSYTLSFWVKVVSDADGVILQARGATGSGGKSFVMYYNNNGNNWHVGLDSDNLLKGVSASNLQVNSEWVHVVGVWNSADYVEIAANQFKLFVNGQQMATTENNFNGGVYPPTSGAIQTILGYHQAWNQYFKGALDDVRIYNRALTNTEIDNLYQAESNASTFSNRGLILHLPFDGNELDISGNNRNATLPGSGVSLTNDRFGVPNKAYSFNGTSAMSVGWNQLTGNTARTASVWFKTNATGSGIFLGWGGNNTNLVADIGNLVFSSVSFLGYFGYSNDTYISPNTYSDNQWHQLVFTHDGATSKLYIDGNLKKTETRSYNTSASALKIGSSASNSSFFNGNLDEVRVYSRALSEQEVESLYKIESNSNPLIAYYPLDGDVNDISGNNNHATNNGASPTTDRFGASNKAMAFNGTSSFIESLPLQEKSLSFWIETAVQDQMQIFSGGNSGVNDQAFQVGIYKPNGFSAPGFIPSTFGLLINFWGNDVAVPFDQIKTGWHHIVISWDGQTTLKISIDGNAPTGYVNNGSGFGALVSQPFTLARKPKPNPNEPTLIGKGKTGPWNLHKVFWNGKIDDFKIFNRALSNAEMTNLYNGLF